MASKHRKSIKRNGLKNSSNGRLGHGVYFVQAYGQAKKIGLNRHGAGEFDIWKVDLTHANSIGSVISGRHPPWAGLQEFQSSASTVATYSTMVHSLQNWCRPIAHECVTNWQFEILRARWRLCAISPPRRTVQKRHDK